MTDSNVGGTWERNGMRKRLTFPAGQPSMRPIEFCKGSAECAERVSASHLSHVTEPDGIPKSVEKEIGMRTSNSQVANVKHFLVVAIFCVACLTSVCWADNCTNLLSLSIPDTEIKSAAMVAASGTSPAQCRVTAVTHGEPGSNVGVEVRMP